MADRFPLILNTSANQIQEIGSGDQLDLSGNNIANAGIITAGNVTIGAATTDLIVSGDARITGILTIGTSSLKLDGPNNLVNVGTALTLGHSQGLQFHTQNLHSAGFEVNQINVSGASTIGGNLDANGDLDVDGHTNLDNVSVAGVTTTAGLLDINNGGQANTFKVEDLTSGRVVLAGTGGELEDSNNLTFDGSNLSVSGNLSVGGVLTYEDVTNVDSVGLITARNGIDCNGDLDVDGHTELDNVRISGFTTTSDQILITTPNSKAASITTQNMPLVVRAYSGSTTGITTVLFDSLYQRHPEFVFQGTHNGNWDATSHWRLLWKSTDSGTTDEIVQIKPITDIGGSIQYAEIKVTDNSTGMKNCARFSAQQQSFLANNQPVFFINQTGIGITDTIYHHSDTNTKIRFPANDTISFETAGSERLRIDSNGHTRFGPSGDGFDSAWGHSNYGNTEVAIDSPTGYSVLHFRGEGANTTDTRYSIGCGDEKFYMAYDDVDNRHNIVVTGVGNVGINKSNPATTLDVDGTATATLFSGSGASLTTLNGSNIASGTVPVARIGTGTKNNTTFYRGDGTFQVVNTDLVSDTSPQLGGDLDCNNKVVSLNDSTGAGNNRLKIGNAGDLQLFHTSNANYVSGEVDGKDLYVRSRRDLHLVCGNNSGGYRNVIYADNNGTARLYHPASGAVRLQTSTTGVTVTGSIVSSQFGSLGNASGVFGRIRVGADVYGNTIKVVLDQNMNLTAHNSIAFNLGAATNGSDTGSAVCLVVSDAFRPISNNTKDLGTSTYRWRNVYTNDLNLSNEGGANDVDGTWGDFTIQEGESDLFLINKRNGKKYKFNLTEVV